MPLHRSWVLLVLGALGAGCGAPATSRPPVPPAPRDEPVSAPANRTGPWTFAYATGEHRFEILSVAAIEALESQSVDSVTTLTYLTYAMAHEGEELHVRGTIDSFFVAAGDSIPRATHELGLPIAFSARMDRQGHLLEFASPDTSTCGSAAGTLLGTARDLLPATPSTLTLGATWTDSTSSEACRGDIPITIATTREHRVEGVDDGVLRVARRGAVQIHGVGSRRVQTTTVTGEGSSTMTLRLDPATGLLRGGVGESTSTLTFDAASRRLTFRQRARTEIRLLAAPGQSSSSSSAGAVTSVRGS